MSSRPVSERAVIFLIGAVQFVNILDFVMVMPLGPDFAKGLGIDSSHIGYIAGSYTAAASVAGLVGGAFLDRFDRRKALAISMLGLVLATAAGGLATGLSSLMLARVLAGLFGGPATSLAMSIVAELIPVERRGRAMGAVMGAFSVASVVGVPLALYVAELGGWRMPFFTVAALGLLVVLGAVFYLPPIRGHLEEGRRRDHPVGAAELLQNRDVQISYMMSALVMMAGFILIPNISAYVQQNLHYPREFVGRIYFFGGIISFITLRLAGPRVDKFGAFRVGTVGAVLSVIFTYIGFVNYPYWLPIPLLFMGYMMANGLRNVAYNTLTSRVPSNAVRARFMSLQSAVGHMASAAGAFLSSKILVDLPDGTLGGMGHVAMLSILLTLMVPPMLLVVERRIRARDQAAAAQVVGVGPGGAVALAPSSSSSHH
jgi:predicted MFS family arabinose efflux permease